MRNDEERRAEVEGNFKSRHLFAQQRGMWRLVGVMVADQLLPMTIIAAFGKTHPKLIAMLGARMMHLLDKLGNEDLLNIL